MYKIVNSISTYLDTLETVGYIKESSIVALLLASFIDDLEYLELTESEIELKDSIKRMLDCNFCILTNN